jgi:hypothetical protein
MGKPALGEGIAAAAKGGARIRAYARRPTKHRGSANRRRRGKAAPAQYLAAARPGAAANKSKHGASRLSNNARARAGARQRRQQAATSGKGGGAQN